MDYKGAGDGRVSQKCLKQVSLRLGFASEGWHNDLAQYYYSIFCDGPREIGPIRKTQEYNHSVSEAKMEILANLIISLEGVRL